MPAPAYAGPKWSEDAGTVPVAEVAAALGLEARSGGRSLSPCPSCNAVVREGRENTRTRGPVGLRPDGRGWRCHRCDASGDGLTLAALVLTGAADAGGGAGWAAVREWYAARGWCEGENGASSTTTRPTPARRPRPPTPEPPAPRPEGAAEVWAACRPVLDDPEVSTWLRSRGLDPAKVEDRDLARALPEDLDAPPWARCNGRPWTAGWRCVLPAYSSTGRLESLRARWCRAEDPDGPKETAPAGASAGGLVLADALGRELLRTGARPSWWPEGEPLRVVVAEGCPDFLTWAVRWSEAALYAPAVLGLWAGSWTPEVAARVPDGARVAVRPHRDPAGNHYAWREVWASLVPRLGLGNVLRPRVPAGLDDNDLLRRGRLPLDPFEDVEDVDDAG